MNKDIVFDIETYGDIRDFKSMKVTVASIYRYETDSYHSYEEHELGQLWPIFETCDRIIGYNSEHFDVPILDKYYAGDLTQVPHLDLLKVIKESCGKRYKLDDVAKATLNIQKSADGLQAMRWWEEGKVDLIKEYCEQDVKVTKDVYDFGMQNKQLFIKTLAGELQPIPVDFIPSTSGATVADSGSAALNLTLPF